MALLYSEVKEAVLASKNDGQMFKQMFSTCGRVSCVFKSLVFESTETMLFDIESGPKVFEDYVTPEKWARGILTSEKFLKFLTERQEIKDTRNLVFYPDLKNHPIHKTLSSILLKMRYPKLPPREPFQNINGDVSI